MCSDMTLGRIVLVRIKGGEFDNGFDAEIYEVRICHVTESWSLI